MQPAPISVPKRMRHPTLSPIGSPVLDPAALFLYPHHLHPPDFRPTSAPAALSAPCSAQTVPSMSPCLLAADPAAAAVSLSLAAIDAGLGVGPLPPSPAVALNAVSAADIDAATSYVSRPPRVPTAAAALPWLPPYAGALPAASPIEEQLDAAMAAQRHIKTVPALDAASLDRALSAAAAPDGARLSACTERRSADAPSASSSVSCSTARPDRREENSHAPVDCVLERLRMVENELDLSAAPILTSTTVTSPPIRRPRAGRICKRSRPRA